jgi:hypothetical protein
MAEFAKELGTSPDQKKLLVRAAERYCAAGVVPDYLKASDCAVGFVSAPRPPMSKAMRKMLQEMASSELAYRKV